MDIKLCECGCGLPAPIATMTDRHAGKVKGQPRRFIPGHYMKKCRRALNGDRICTQCGVAKPETGEFWVLKPSGGAWPWCKECRQRRWVDYLNTHRKQVRIRNTNWNRKRRATPEGRARQREIQRKCEAKIKAEMIATYGSKCSCCGITEPEFLTLEHVNRDGAAHRKSLNSGGGSSVWRDLKKRGWPKDGFTLLCWNCNCATRFGQPCPHTRRL